MLRCTIDILPGGDANRARIVGLVLPRQERG